MNGTFSLNSEVARKVHLEYVRVLQELELKRKGSQEAQYLTRNKPSVEHFHSLIEAAFWASLQRIEGRHHRFSIAVCPKTSVDEPFIFKKEREFDSETLAKLSPALDAERTLIGVWPEDEDKLSVWGFLAADPRERLFVRVFDAGQIVVGFGLGGRTEYASFSAVVRGSRFDFIERGIDPLLNTLSRAVRARDSGSKLDSAQLFYDFRSIARQMRSHAHGGILLIVPAEVNLQGSAKFDGYAIDPYGRPGTEYSEYQRELFERPREPKWGTHALKSFGQLTAIDGATIVTYDLTVLAFGAKILSKEKLPGNVLVLVSEPFKEDKSRPIPVSELGWGMRHSSAAQFVFDQRKAVAIVASQDGELSIFEWNDDCGWTDDRGRKERGAMLCVMRHAEYALL